MQLVGRTTMARRSLASLCLAMAPLCAPATGGRAGDPNPFTPTLFFSYTEPGGRVRNFCRAAGIAGEFVAGGVELRVGGIAVGVEFAGAGRVLPVPLGRPTGTANLLHGAASGWRANLPAYTGFVYRGLYSGIDLVYGASRMLKSEFLVAPGARPEHIRLRYRGAEQVRVDDGGALVVATGEGEIREAPPTAYQEIGKRRVPVRASFVLDESGIVSFALGPYDASRALVIDPALTYSSYLGGGRIDAVTAMAVDSSGSLYLTGYTDSFDFPIFGALQAVRAGGADVFLVKLAPDGQTFRYATYFGGAHDDRAFGLAVDAAGNAIVAGWTYSFDFPVSAARQPKVAGGRDAFVARLNTSGTGFVYSTLHGGAGSDTANAVAVDAWGNAYIAGDTGSTNLPIRNAYRSGLRGLQDAFAAKFSPAGVLVYGTYLGGSGDERALGIAVDSSGAAYITGSTTSTDYPIVNAFRGMRSGWQDAFATKLAPGGSAAAYSTYLGGSGLERGTSIAVDLGGVAYIAGMTSSVDFPLASPIQSAFGGVQDGFALALTNQGSGLVFSTYVGGTGVDEALAIGLISGSVLIAGSTMSSDFPVVNATQPSLVGRSDAFVVQLGGTGTTRLFSTYLGGSGAEAGSSLAASGGTAMWVAGQTDSRDLQILQGIQPVAPSSINGFLARFDLQSTTTTPNYIGYIDKIACDSIRGWAADRNRLNTSLNIELLDGSTVIGSFIANVLRADVGTFLGDNGIHGFDIATPTALIDGWTHSVSVRVAGTTHLLEGGPQLLTCTTPGTGTPNLAEGKAAAQSSTPNPAWSAASAVDGDTNGNIVSGSVTHTGLDVNAWWQVDLGATAVISSIEIWNRSDCCGDRLSDYWVFVSDTAFAASETPITLQTRPGTWSSRQTSVPSPSTTIQTGGVQGRYIRVQLAGSNYLSLAEVKVKGQTAFNLAQGKVAAQSSVPVAAWAARNAVDGNSDGNIGSGSVTHTGLDVNAWWQVDLGAAAVISGIEIWNRSDCCGERLGDYWIFVSDTPFGPWETPMTLQTRVGTWSSRQSNAPSPSAIIQLPGVQGRYVRVQLAGTNYLSLAEVKVTGQSP
ncbi:MAG: discoidin domain-containing protein [Acidobacteria bacterium]|nr:discoidin domain-containing protein [Acidobacteriota bacterium]